MVVVVRLLNRTKVDRARVRTGMALALRVEEHRMDMEAWDEVVTL